MVRFSRVQFHERHRASESYRKEIASKTTHLHVLVVVVLAEIEDKRGVLSHITIHQNAHILLQKAGINVVGDANLQRWSRVDGGTHIFVEKSELLGSGEN